MKKKNGISIDTEPTGEEILKVSTRMMAKIMDSDAPKDVMDLADERIGNVGMLILSKLMSQITVRITELNLSNSNITSAGMQFLAKGLYNNNTISVFDISHNKISGEDCDSISGFIHTSQVLEKCNLAHNALGKIGAVKIASALTQNKSLTFLDVSNNILGNKGIEEIGKALKINKTLVQIEANGNSIGNSGIQWFSKHAIHNQVLKTASFENNEIGYTGIRALNKLVANSRLTDVKLYNNELYFLAKQLEANQSAFDFKDNTLSLSGNLQILEKEVATIIDLGGETTDIS